jgi:arabinogalactan endo-1,4-beta-galactosidase
MTETTTGSRRTLLAGFLLPAALLAMCSCPAFARLEDDTLTSGSLDTCRWGDWSQGGTVTPSASSLRMSTGTQDTFSGTRVISQYRIPSDATIRADVTPGSGFDAAIPDSAQMYAGLGLWTDETHFVFIAIAKAGSRNVIRTLRSNGTNTFQSGSDVSITTLPSSLRIQQAGGSATLQYGDGQTWRTAATLGGFADAYVMLLANTVGVSRAFSADFRNFAVESGATSYRQYTRGAQVHRDDFLAGANVGDFMDYRFWGGQWQDSPFPQFRANGMNLIATDMTTVSSSALAALPASRWGELAFDTSFWRSQEIGTQLLKDATASGLRPYLQIYLSDQAANYGAQKAPSAWQGLSAADTADRVRTYTQSLVSALRSQGVRPAYYAVGNEIEAGIVGFRPADFAGGRIPLRPGVPSSDLDYLRQDVWPVEAQLLKAAIAGIRASDPQAHVVLHAAGTDYSPSDILPKAFFKSMSDNGVPYDYAGLSHPYAFNGVWHLAQYSTDCWMQRLQETAGYIATLGKQTILAEGSYPWRANAYPSPPMVEFPFSQDGQAGWVREMLRFANNDPDMAGFLYFYPDYYVGMGDASNLGLQYSGLFQSAGQPTAALKEFGAGTKVPANHSGLWWNSNESGWGINLEQQGDIVFATLFTYDATGKPTWFVMSNGTRTSGESFTGDLYRTSGSAFDAQPFVPIGAANVTRVGTMTVAFDDAGTTLTYAVDGKSVTKQIDKQVFGAGAASCISTTGDRSALTNFQDLWWNAAESGWGLNVAQQGATIFATLFSYDAGGKPTWFVMSGGARQADGSYVGDLFQTTGPAFDAVPFTPIGAQNVTKVGSMQLRFADGISGTLAYSVNGKQVTKAITRQVFSTPVGACS